MKQKEVDQIKKEYNALKKHYTLPKFEELDQDFELRRIEPDGFLLREIMVKICMKFMDYVHMLDPALDIHPSSLHSIIESGAFTKNEKKKVLDVYRSLGAFAHEAYAIDLDGDKAKVDFIKRLYAFWKLVKPDLMRYAQKISEEWGRKIEEEELPQGYFG